MKAQKFIKLKAQKERAILNFHPWIFSGAVKQGSPNLCIGDQVTVLASDNTPLALAHYCGETSLMARIFCFDPYQIINDDFWLDKFNKALNLRQTVGLPSKATNAFRFLHGEGDGLSGLVCDIFDDSAYVRLSNEGLKNILDLLKSFLAQNLNIKNFLVEHEQTNLEKEFIENNLKFVAHMGDGQKTGHFLDQRENRLLLQKYVKNKNVLDAFCYSGGFSVYALKNSAKSVMSVDISQDAIAQCNKNINLNKPYTGTHEAIAKDCFNYLRELAPKQFDVIILDPPAFAKSASCIDKAARGYKDINLCALKALESGGILFTFSCSQHISTDLFKKIIFAAAKDAQKDVKIIHELCQSTDHPTSIFCPQSSYLKGLVLYVG